MSAKTDRDMWLKRLKPTKENAAKGRMNHEDDRNIAAILEMLIKRSFEKDIRNEKHDKLMDNVMDSMDWEDFQ